MYNRYISSQGEDYFKPMDEFEAPAFEEAPPNFNEETQNQGRSGGFFSNIRNMFGGNKENGEGGLNFDMDTIFMLVLVYFLIMDDKKGEEEGKNENMMETLLIIAALFLFGF